MERSTESPEAHVSSSAAACGRPWVSARSSTWPRRRCVLAASTCDGNGLEDDGVVERLVATNDCDAGVPHVAHSRRGCLVSSATTVQLRFTATTVDCRRRTTSDNCWTPEVVTPPRHTSSISSTCPQNIRHDVCSGRLSCSNYRSKIARFS